MKTIETLLECFAGIFPKQDNYQSRLEQYINSKHPTNAADVDYWCRQYEENSSRYWSSTQ